MHNIPCKIIEIYIFVKIKFTMASYLKKYLFITLMLLLFTNLVFAQQKIVKNTGKPKVGLVLSGGGAKGFAHLGLLELIDSLQIKVDYISGTSMGAILGEMYAMGYTAKEIKEIVTTTDWSRILSDKAPLNKINMEEKSEYNQYVLEFPCVKFMPGLPVSLIEGQYISETFNQYTYPARGVNDFSKLPIPLVITSSDIVKGELVLQKNGSLPLAMSATSAIPVVFAPVYIDGKLLVDGGLMKNFPVQEVIDMGANLIIAGYTGFRMHKENELNNPTKLISQTYAITSAKDSDEEKQKTDVYVDFNHDLGSYSSSDFNKCAKIIEIGEGAARKVLPQLIKIAERQRAEKIEYVHEKVNDTSSIITNYNFINEKGEKIKRRKEILTLRKLLQLKDNTYYTSEEINEAMERIYGTRIYSKVFTAFENSPKGLEMNVHLKKGPKAFLKTAIHYDNEQKAGILLNYTYYNAFDYHSKLITTIDLAERFKARLKYAFIVDPKNRIWLNLGAEYQNLKNNDFLLNSLYSAEVSKQTTDFYKKIYNAYLGISYGMLKNMSWETGVAYEGEDIARITNAIDFMDEEGFISNKKGREAFYKHHDFATYFRIKQNSMDEAYYAKKGNRFIAEAKYVFYNKLHVMDTASLTEGEKKVFTYVTPNPYSDLSALDGFLRIYANEEYALKISKRFTFKVNAFYGISISREGVVGADSYMPFNNKFAFGGYQRKHFNDNPEFAGFKEGALPFNSGTAVSLGIQYNPYKKLYVTPVVSLGWMNDNFNVFKNISEEGKAAVGAGFNIGYMSFLGPINFNFNTGAMESVTTSRTSISIGFKF